MLLQSVVFVGLVRIRFTLDIVNDKKRVIVLFNLPVFLLLSPSPFPHSTKAHADDTWEPSWADRHIIPYYQTAGKARTPPDPLDTEEQIILLECGLGQVEGSMRVKKALWRHPCPLCCTVSFKSVCWQSSDNNFGPCAMFCLAVMIIFIERTSLLIKLLSFVWSCFARFFVWFASPCESSVSLLTCRIVRMVSLFQRKIMFIFEEAIIGIKKRKVGKYHKKFPNFSLEMMIFDI